MVETWRSRTIYNMIVDALHRRGGTAKDKDIYELIRSEFDLSYMEFLKALMVLELRGFIKVSLLKDDIRWIELLAK